MTSSIDEVIRGYASAASPELIGRYEAIAAEEVLAPVIDLLPTEPACIADIGAGTGRDAAWLARRGHRLVAIEPAGPLREAGRAMHAALPIRWVDDRLPHLAQLASEESAFDLILLVGVWQHLDEMERRRAVRRLAGLAAPGGRLILSFRHGPGGEGRPVHPGDPRVTIAAAHVAGFSLIRRRCAEAVQEANRAAGVSWTWLAFERR